MKTETQHRTEPVFPKKPFPEMQQQQQQKINTFKRRFQNLSSPGFRIGFFPILVGCPEHTWSSSSSIWCPFPRKVRTIPPNLLGTSSEGEHLGATPRRGKRARDSVRIKFTNLGAAQESASETATVPGTQREREPVHHQVIHRL